MHQVIIIISCMKEGYLSEMLLQIPGKLQKDKSKLPNACHTGKINVRKFLLLRKYVVSMSEEAQYGGKVSWSAM